MSQGDNQTIRIIAVFKISTMDMKKFYLALSEISERSIHILPGKKLSLLHVAEQEVSHISHILFSSLISDHSILLTKSVNFFIKLNSQMHR